MANFFISAKSFTCIVMLKTILSLFFFSFILSILSIYNNSKTDMLLKSLNGITTNHSMFNAVILSSGSFCERKGKKWIVLTSINYPTASVKRLLTLTEWVVLVIADHKTPLDYEKHLQELEKERLVFLSLEKQKLLNFRVAKMIPFNSYARKNIGYLYAITCNAEWIYETDDDNIIKADFGFTNFLKPETDITEGNPECIEAIPNKIASKIFLCNPYAYFGKPCVWPRGYPIQHIHAIFGEEYYKFKRINCKNPQKPWIRQGIADKDPDIDAIFRLTRPNEIGKIIFGENLKILFIPENVYVPFNTQNTLYSKEAFWGLLLPYSVSARVCDIWRGFWVQKVLWYFRQKIAFYPANVIQERNPHNFLKDFAQETDLYLNSGNMINFLSHWVPDFPYTSSNDLYSLIIALVEKIASNHFWSNHEVDLAKNWIADLNDIGYFPPILNDLYQESVALTKNETKTAVCVFGTVHDLAKWNLTSTLKILKIFGEKKYIDLFLYASNELSLAQEISDMLKQVEIRSAIVFNGAFTSDTSCLNSSLVKENAIAAHSIQKCITLIDESFINSFKQVLFIDATYGMNLDKPSFLPSLQALRRYVRKQNVAFSCSQNYENFTNSKFLLTPFSFLAFLRRAVVMNNNLTIPSIETFDRIMYETFRRDIC